MYTHYGQVKFLEDSCLGFPVYVVSEPVHVQQGEALCEKVCKVVIVELLIFRMTHRVVLAALRARRPSEKKGNNLRFRESCAQPEGTERRLLRRWR